MGVGGVLVGVVGSSTTADMHYVRWPPAVNFDFFGSQAPAGDLAIKS